MTDKIDSHPLDIPDSTMRWRQGDTSQEAGGEEPWNPEEREIVDTPFSHARNEPSVSDIKKGRGGGRKGGGLGAVDAYVEDVGQEGNADPEMMHLVREYNRYAGQGGRLSFGNWLEGEEKPRGAVELHLVVKSLENKDAERTARGLQNVWRDPEAKLTYIKSGKPGGADDELSFKSDFLGEQNGGEFRIKVADFNDLLSGDGIRMRVLKPRDNNDWRAVMGLFKHLQIGKDVYQGRVWKVVEEIKATEKKPTPVDKGGFNLVFYQPALDRLTQGLDPVKDKAELDRINSVKDFWGVWTHGQNEISAVGFGVDENKTKITSVITKLKDGESIVVPAHVFRRVFDVWAHQGKGGMGLKFVGGGENRAYIDPHTPQKMLEDIMAKVNINGVKLNLEKVRVFMGPYEAPGKA